jgi:arylsulfatase A-like enzyme
MHRALLTLALLAGGAAPAAAPAGPARDALRVTVVVLDDVGFAMLAQADTPVLDRLRAGGAWFTNFWTYPTCTPARAALLTGRHAHRTGVGTLISPTTPHNPGLPLAETTLAELLVEPVEYFGKWHLGHRLDDPRDQGFAHYAGGRWNLATGGGQSYYQWLKTTDGVETPVSVYATLDTTDDALASSARTRVVSYHAVHNPAHNPPGGTAPDLYHQTLEMLEYLDAQLGRLLLGYEGLVFVLSDNGAEPLMGGQKGTLHEGGVNVPLVVYGPGVVPGEREDLVSIVDLYATLAELRGVPSAAEDSISFLPVLSGLPGARRYSYAEMFTPNGGSENHRRAIRDRDYKLIVRDGLTVEFSSMPGEVAIPPPWTAAQQAAYGRLRAALP